MLKLRRLLSAAILAAACALYLSDTSKAADIKISQLPLGAASATGGGDSFPYVSYSTSVTKRLTLWDISNLPTIVSTYAPKANPVFSGVVTAPSFIGALSGNADTATALAAIPTGCSANQFSNAIAASGNLTCAQPAFSNLAGTFTTAQVGTNAVTNAGLAQMATNTIKGNNTAGTANALDLTVAQTNTLLGDLLISNNLSDVSNKATSFNNLSPMTTLGDVIYGGASGTGTRLGGNTTTTKKFLRETGDSVNAAAPAWDTLAASDLPTIALTSDVTGSASGGSIATTIAANVVTNSKLAQMTAHTFKGNNTASTANALDLSATQLTAELDNAVGDSGSGGTKGLVPAPAAGDAAAGKFLNAGMTWSAPSGGGAALTALYNVIFGSAAQVTAGTATNSTFASWTQADGDRVLILPGYTESAAWTVSHKAFITGLGNTSQITGAVTLASGSSYSMVKNIRITGALTLNTGVAGAQVVESWQATGQTVTDNGTGDYLQLISE